MEDGFANQSQEVVTSNTFNSDGVMFEYTQSRHHPEHFRFQDTASRKRL